MWGGGGRGPRLGSRRTLIKANNPPSNRNPSADAGVSLELRAAIARGERFDRARITSLQRFVIVILGDETCRRKIALHISVACPPA